MTASWRTSLFGASGLVIVLANTIARLLDGDPTTNPDWAAVAAAISACIGLLFARDHKVSSEEAGIK
jgi:hypothetical protein